MDNSSVDIDVIILSLDRVGDTVLAIASALDQVGIRKQIWVIDQASKPETVATLKKYTTGMREVHLELLDTNLGVAGGRNLGSRLGRAPFIVALDNDAVFDGPYALQTAVQLMTKDPGLGGISFRILDSSTKNDEINTWPYPKALWSRRGQEFLTAKFIGGGHMLRRSAFERAGGYDDELFFCLEELDLSFRMINLGYKIKYTPQIRVFHKSTPERRVDWKTNRYFYYVRNRIYIEYKYGKRLYLLTAIGVGYLVKGLYNGVFIQAIRGIVAAIRMSGRHGRAKKRSSLYQLSAEAQAYIRKNDAIHRGSFLNRLKQEVVSALPQKSSASVTQRRTR